MPRVQFEKIVKSFGRVTVLKNLDLQIEDGEFIVLLGPSGCGKTTLLNLLAGLLDVSSGRIQIGERDVTELDPKDRGLAMVFQSYALYPTKTVRGNLKFGMAAARLAREEQERRIAWAARLLQIEALLDRKPAIRCCCGLLQPGGLSGAPGCGDDGPAARQPFTGKGQAKTARGAYDQDNR